MLKCQSLLQWFFIKNGINAQILNFVQISVVYKKANKAIQVKHQKSNPKRLTQNISLCYEQESKNIQMGSHHFHPLDARPRCPNGDEYHRTMEQEKISTKGILRSFYPCHYFERWHGFIFKST
jgi:hypothetical protein